MDGMLPLRPPSLSSYLAVRRILPPHYLLNWNGNIERAIFAARSGFAVALSTIKSFANSFVGSDDCEACG